MVLNSFNVSTHYKSNAIVSFICSRNTAIALCRNVGSMNLTSRRLTSGVVKQPGIGLWSSHFFV